MELYSGTHLYSANIFLFFICCYIYKVYKSNMFKLTDSSLETANEKEQVLIMSSLYVFHMNRSRADSSQDLLK